MLIHLVLLGAAYIGYRGWMGERRPAANRRMVSSGVSAGAVTAGGDASLMLSSAAGGLLSQAPAAAVGGMVGFGAICWSALPVMLQAERGARENGETGHSLVISALIVTSVTIGSFGPLAVALFFYHLANRTIAESRRKTALVLGEAFRTRPQAMVWVERGGVELELELDKLVRGDLVVLASGDPVPVDGVIERGYGMIVRQAVTGESRPVECGPGDSVIAATLLVHGKIRVRVERTGEETMTARIGEMLERTTDPVGREGLQGERMADLVALPALALAGAVVPFRGLAGASSILHCFYGNRLRVVAPTATMRYLRAAAADGLLIKDGRALERLSEVDCILFDKTGTLTEESVEVDRVFARDGWSSEQVVATATVAQARFSHPIARALNRHTRENRIELPTLVTDLHFHPGYGVGLKVDNRACHVGSHRFVAEILGGADFLLPGVEQALEAGDSLIHVACEGELVGSIALHGRVRPGIDAMLKGLAARGVGEMAIVSGDQQAPTRRVAEQVGISNYFYEVLPQEKAAIVRHLQQQGRVVCFVGDGVNDALAMRQADLSISLRGASTIASDVAHVVLLDGRLESIPQLIGHSHALAAHQFHGGSLLIGTSALNLSGSLLFGTLPATAAWISNIGFVAAMGHTLYGREPAVSATGPRRRMRL
jgi:P-type E1-E2 ATPase